MRISNSLSRLSCLLFFLSAWPLLAPAAERSIEKSGKKDEFQIHYQAAMQQYKKENFEQALIEFQKAYEQDALPRLLFNIGQLHKKLGHVRDAVDAYELFLKTDNGLSLKQREEVQRVINELRGTDPALEPTPAALLPAPPSFVAPGGKAGRFMANFGLGVAVGLNIAHLHAALQLEAGYSVLSNRNGYIVLPLQFQLSDTFKLIMIPVGFHYDFALPIRGLYLGARASLGYAVGITEAPAIPIEANGTLVSHFVAFIPEVSIKYVLKGRVNLGLLPMSFPVLFNGTTTLAYYRLMLFGGANF